MESKMEDTFIGVKCVVRTYASGVHYGTLAKRSGREVLLHNSRRLWEWDTGGTGISLSEIAITGIAQDKSKICVRLPEILILDALEIIPCTGMAIVTIEGAAVHRP